MKQKVIFAGGGTAGHIEPALAVADALGAKDPEISCEFIGTNSKLEQTLIPSRGYVLKVIPKVAMPRRVSKEFLTFPVNLIKAILAASKICKGASALVGFGGYVSAASYIAARITSVPIIIHEANAKPGWANRLGRKFAVATAVNFPSLLSIWPSAILSGMPIRNEISKVGNLDQKVRRELRSKFLNELGLNPDLPLVAVFGGSQGSRSLNQAVAEFLQSESSNRVQIIHALGMANVLPEVRENYRPMSYFHDMASIYLAADLLLTRSGAVTCAEIQSTNSSAILVPLPHGNGEQFLNAHELEVEGFAIVVNEAELKENWLERNLSSQLEKARNRSTARNTLHQNAADQIANLVLKSMRVAD